MVTLFHGAKSKITEAIKKMSPTASVSKRMPKTDFGMGFYMTDDKDFARIISCGAKNAEPYLYTFELDETALKTFVFKPSVSWLMFVGANRREFDISVSDSFRNFYNEISQEYDLLTGPIANDRSFRIINRFFNPLFGDIPLTCDVALLNLIGMDTCKQYTTITDFACGVATDSIVEVENLGPEKQNILIEREIRYAEANRKADGIVRDLMNMRLNGYKNPYQMTFEDIMGLLKAGRDVYNIPGWSEVDTKMIEEQADEYHAQTAGQKQGGSDDDR